MEIQKLKQTVYLPVKVEDEIPELDGYYRTQEEGTSYLHNGNWFNNDLLEKPRYPIHWLKEQESFVFTPEELNEYTANVIKQALELAAEKAKFGYNRILVDDPKEGDNAYMNFPKVDRESITGTFEDTCRLFFVD